MFDKFGQPTGGYGQEAPGKDLPNPASPQQTQVQPLQTAISGGPQAIPQYQPDPGLMSWRQGDGQSKPIGGGSPGLGPAINPFMAQMQGGFQTPNSSISPLPNIPTGNNAQPQMGTQPLARAPQMTPGANAPASQGGLAPQAWQGGGWDNPRGTAAGLSKAFSMGLKGQAAVDWTNSNGHPGIAYYADKNQFGLPDGQYAAPNPTNPNTMDLIQRGGGGGSSASGSVGNPLMQAIAGNQQNQMQQTNQTNQSYLQQMLANIPH